MSTPPLSIFLVKEGVSEEDLLDESHSAPRENWIYRHFRTSVVLDEQSY